MDSQAMMIAKEIMRRKKMAEGGMVKDDELESVPMPNQEDFLSDEQDDSMMLHDNEDFLSDEMENGPDQLMDEPNVPDNPNEKPLLVSIMERMKFEKMRKK